MSGSQMKTVALFLSLIPVVEACSSYHGPTVAGVSSRLTAGLHSGDSEAKIRAVLQGLGVELVYDEVSNRLEGTAPNHGIRSAASRA